MTSSAASRLRSLLNGVANRRLLFLRFASSSSFRKPETAAACPRNRTASVFEDQPDGGGSAAYNHAVRYSRPLTINLYHQRAHLSNSVSLIGTVERTPTAYNKLQGGPFGGYLILSVKSSPDSNSSIRIFVEMWNEIAKVALEHVKPGDYIYVSGFLESFRKQDNSGNYISEYKVVGKELNFVKQHDEKQKSQELQQSETQGESSITKSKEDRLHLWQVFFSNPMEWIDNRKNKTNKRSPDFKNKSTGEALWLIADDPTWIKKQLELYDTMVEAGCFKNSRYSHNRHVSSYMSDDLV
ncbi:hypothetical protein V2J09_007165 [Rumex salicifolius]